MLQIEGLGPQVSQIAPFCGHLGYAYRRCQLKKDYTGFVCTRCFFYTIHCLWPQGTMVHRALWQLHALSPLWGSISPCYHKFESLVLSLAFFRYTHAPKRNIVTGANSFLTLVHDFYPACMCKG